MKIMDIIIEELNKNSDGDAKFKRLHSEQYEIVTTKNGKFHNKVTKQQNEDKNKMYKAEYFDDSFEIISYVNNDNEALNEAYEMEDGEKFLIGLFEVDEDYNEIRTIF